MIRLCSHDELMTLIPPHQGWVWLGQKDDWIQEVPIKGEEVAGKLLAFRHKTVTFNLKSR